MLCPICGNSLKIIGGPDGNPYNTHNQESLFCQQCGYISKTSLKNEVTECLYIVITSKAEGMGIIRENTYYHQYQKDVGVHLDNQTFWSFDLSKEDYPLSNLGGIIYTKQYIRILGENYSLNKPIKIVKQKPITTFDGHPAVETDTYQIELKSEVIKDEN